MNLETPNEVKLARAIQQLQVQNEHLQKALLGLGRNPDGFDWAVLDKIDTLETENEKYKRRISELTSECLEVEGNLSEGYKKINQLEAENKDLHKEYQDLAGINLKISNKNKRLKEALEWFEKDLKEIKTMNEPTFFTICNHWLPHIRQALEEK